MPRKGEGVCEAVVIVAMWHGNSWRFCVAFSSQMSPKIWKIFKIIPTENDSIFSEENWSKELDTLVMIRMMWSYCTKARRWWEKSEKICWVRPHNKICPNMSMHASKGSLEMFVSWNQKNKDIGTWNVRMNEDLLPF